MQLALRAIYYLAWWCVVTALSLLVVAVPFMIGQTSGVDDDVTWLIGIPLGLLLFVPAARWALRLRRLHKYMVGIGGVGLIVAVALGIALLRKSEELTGVTGPFAGSGELIAAGFCFFAGIVFIAVAVAGATGIGIRRSRSL
jgi:hypothetical protein